MLTAAVAKPAMVMHLSLVTSILGGIALAFFADTSKLWLQLGVAVFGAGIGNILVTGFLWLEGQTVITSKMRSLLIIASKLGARVVTTVIGQFIMGWPMLLMYMVPVMLILSLLLFLVASFLLQRIKD
jgi:hypothetical protein